MANTASLVDGTKTLANSKRMHNLQQIYQEVLTVVVRLRANRQRIGEPEVFRAQIRSALKAAEQEGLRIGYTLEDLRVAAFAIIAFLDESVLNSQNPVFSDWAREPLQQELFGIHIAGEIFFRNVDRLLGRSDSDQSADLLEIHQLCLLLGFRGRYSATSGDAEIRAILTKIEDKIGRVYGNSAPNARKVNEVTATSTDQWTAALKWTAVASVLLALILFASYSTLLSSALRELITASAVYKP